ncbi:MAG: 4Fe-4S dicluster domain-containing protein [archaeon]|nr:4Fe-4S dicluster domain-containing protein [archaeon]
MGETINGMKKELNVQMISTRRDFIKKMAIGGGAIIFFGNLGLLQLSCKRLGQAGECHAYSMILVDYSKCTGCRICETVCSAYNHTQKVNGKVLPGLGNPFYSNIRVYSFNPDVDIPAVCAMCPDNPCINACTVPFDPKTGKKALYRDDKTSAIKNDPNRCIGCGSCAEACSEQSAGVIVPNLETNKPEGMCNLCGGDPQCVKYCPYGALSLVEVSPDEEFYRMPSELIAKEWTKRWYTIQ